LQLTVSAVQASVAVEPATTADVPMTASMVVTAAVAQGWAVAATPPHRRTGIMTNVEPAVTS
jgi:hypothetical protein